MQRGSQLLAQVFVGAMWLLIVALPALAAGLSPPFPPCPPAPETGISILCLQSPCLRCTYDSAALFVPQVKDRVGRLMLQKQQKS